MAQQFDVSLKTLFRYSHGVMSRMLFGGPVAEWLNIEQPDVRNPRADMLAKGSDGKLRHVEFQVKNEPGMALRQLDYYVGFRRLLGEHVEQVLLYVGNEPLRMESVFESPSTRHEFRILNLREMDGEPLLQSSDWGDNELALFTRADRERVIQAVEARLRQLSGGEKTEAARTFVLLSGILGIEDQIERRIRTGMIDIMENKVFGPMIRKGMEEGRAQGREEGLAEGEKQGMEQMLQAQLERRFGRLPPWVKQELYEADPETLKRLSLRLLDASSIVEVFE